MTAPAREFDEALAFIQLFARGSWASCHVRTDTLEIFISRDTGGRASAGTPASELVEAAAETPRAPHIGTLVELAPIGSRVEAGGRYAVLGLLDERIDLIAERAGAVIDHLQPLGALVEHDQALVRIR